jgi:hypothetical protein
MIASRDRALKVQTTIAPGGIFRPALFRLTLIRTDRTSNGNLLPVKFRKWAVTCVFKLDDIADITIASCRISNNEASETSNTASRGPSCASMKADCATCPTSPLCAATMPPASARKSVNESACGAVMSLRRAASGVP